MSGGGRAPWGLTATIAVLLLAGCADSEPAPAPSEISGPPQRVARVVEQLGQAVRTRDFETICASLLTAAARGRAGGARCAATMAESVGDLGRPRIRLLSIHIAGRRAEARVRTLATGQAPVEETLQLERRGGRYLIAALAR